MSDTKFYATKEFKKLNDEWETKLKDTGFDDIEVTQLDNVVRRQEFKPNKIEYHGGTKYYQLCQDILRDYRFKRDIDKFIFESHTEGKSVRDIEALLRTHSYRLLKFQRIHQIIVRIKREYLEQTK